MEHPLRERIAQLEERRREALQPGTEAAIQRQHDRGKMLARERIEYLLDDGSSDRTDPTDPADPFDATDPPDPAD